jgi:hypothetical protein
MAADMGVLVKATTDSFVQLVVKISPVHDVAAVSCGNATVVVADLLVTHNVNPWWQHRQQAPMVCLLIARKH